jgi:serine/tyrosine/threonine adenylyltransferase
LDAPVASFAVDGIRPEEVAAPVDLGLQFVNSYACLPDRFYTRMAPTPLPDPYLVAWSDSAAELIGLRAIAAASPDTVEALAGNRPVAGAQPLAAVYSGHQFGVYVPRLGDGRAILLGEVVGRDGQGWELQLKGSGKTPYSRMGDGRAVLRSSIREFLCSEALHHLGIPTTMRCANWPTTSSTAGIPTVARPRSPTWRCSSRWLGARHG